MPSKRLYLFLTLTLLLVGAVALTPVQAQGNLLTNPGFEAGGNWNPVASGGGGQFAAPPGWGGWLSPSSPQIPNGFPHNRIFTDENSTEVEAGIANANNLFIRSGNRSANFGRGFGAYTAAIYQQVSVTEGDPLIGTAYMIMNIGSGSDFAASVGIDPNGGTDPNAAGILWSSTTRNQIGSFAQLTINATATGPTATFYIAFTQRAPIDPNGIYWDDASLTVGGPGGEGPGGDDGGDDGAPAPTAVPTVPQTVPNVIPQGQQEDGSIVHTVNTGDTIASIAVAYSVSQAEIIELNGLANPRLLSVGQRLLIRPPTEPTAIPEPTDAPTEEPADEEEDEPVDAAAVDDDQDIADDEEDEEPEPTETSEPTATTEPTEEEPTEVPTSTPTPEPSATSPPAPVAEADVDSDIDLDSTVSSLCVMIYEDMNGDTVQQADELSVPGGLITLTRAGEEVDSFVTDDSPNMSCFNTLEPGQYIVDANAPAGFTLLPSGRSRPNLPPGQQVNIVFAAVDSDTIDVPAPDAADLDSDVAPPTLDTASTGESDDDDLTQYIGLIVFALAAVTLIGGIGLTIAVRGR